jgi:hypothetical protein
MPAERTTMRQVREILRLKFVGGVPSREIARCVGVAASTVRVTIKRFQAAGLVAVLGASNFTYAEATWTQGLSDWIGAHTRAFAAIGAVPRLLVKPACTNRRSTEPMRRWRRITAVSAIIFAPSRGHACRHERTVEPTNSSRIDAKRPRYVDQSFAISQPLQRFLTLMLMELPKAPVQRLRRAGMRILLYHSRPVPERMSSRALPRMMASSS